MTNMGFEVRVAVYDDIDAIEQITNEACHKYAAMVGNDNIQALQETKEDIKPHDIPCIRVNSGLG